MTAGALSALIIDDSEDDAEILVSHLRRLGYEVRYEVAGSEAAIRLKLVSGTFDVVFCDYVMPGLGAQRAFEVVRRTRPELPFFVISALVDEEGAADLLVAGADDFIAKGRYTRLGPIVRRVLAAAEERRARERLQLALDLHTQSDELTGLPTRAAFVDHIRRALVDTPDAPLTVIRLDLVHFARVNETFGHEVGDGVLRDVAGRLAAVAPHGSTLARIASDEFGLVAAAGDTALGHSQRLLAALERPFIVAGQAVHVSASVGIASAPDHGTDAETLVRRAGAATERAKRTGVAALFLPEDDHAGFGIGDVEEFRGAIGRGDLVLHYQPQLEGDPLRVTVVEALVRWAHPAKGLLAPSLFLPLVRHGRLGPLLTQWVLEEALGQCRAWWMAGSQVPVAVNLTMDDAQDPALADRVGQLLAAHELPPAALELELTEDTAITDPLAVEQTVRRLSALGCRIAIDDFGTGYASLTYLQRLPVQRLKIDRSFVQGLMSRTADAVIVRSAIDLGHQLGLSVIAEGVEEEGAWARLRELGCDGAQGYAFARPMPFLELVRWFEADAAGSLTERRRTHTVRFVALAEAAGAVGMAAERRAERFRDLRRERHNLDLALDGAIGRSDAESALRLGAALRFYWVDQGLVARGIEALRRALALPHAQTPTATRAAALNALAVLHGQQQDYAVARPLLQEAAGIQRRLGERKGLAASMSNLGMVLEALGDRDGARDAYLESMAMRRAIGDATGEAHTLSNLSTNAYHRGDLATARAYGERALAIHRTTGDDFGAASVLDTLGAIRADMGDLAGALSAFQASLELYRDLGVMTKPTQPMAGIVMIAARSGVRETALILAGAIEALRARYPSLPALNAEHYERCVDLLQRDLGGVVSAKALVEGRSLTWAEAVALALRLQVPG